ncbi:MAG: GNAT family N-acetyltransferase [Gemmatimonadales bacterium]
MTVRDFAAADLPRVRACFIELQELERALDPRIPAGASVADAYMEGLFRRCEVSAGRLFVAEDEGRVIGFVSVLGACVPDSPDDGSAPFAYVDDLVVLEAYRRRGVGSALLRRAEAYALACGRSSLRLRVKGGNQRARAFYARAGFTDYEVELEKQLDD